MLGIKKSRKRGAEKNIRKRISFNRVDNNKM